MRPLIGLIPPLLLATACQSPPRPPMVDEAQRRPANTALAVALQVCQNDLHNTRLMATESGRLADVTALTLQHLAARQQWLARLQAAGTAQAASAPRADAAASVGPSGPADAPAHAASSAAPPPGLDGAARSTRLEGLASMPAAPEAGSPNVVYTLYFAHGSTALVVPPGVAAALPAQARTAPLVLLRGRTDGQVATPAEARIAQQRAAVVQDYLVAAGMDRARIRSTHQAVGDHAADNTTPAGRALNRRVEIELYRSLPQAGGPGQPGTR